MHGIEDKFIILDGHSLAYRAFYALPLELKTGDGLHTNAVLGFTNMLLRLARDESPSHMAAAFDYPAPTFRHSRYAQYKATREKTPPELSEQLPLIKEILLAFNVPVFEMEGYEADDLIGTFSSSGEAAGLLSLIVTADADAYQLITERARVLITRKGISELEEFGLEEFRKRYGLDPRQWIDYKALRGDSSDNIPGVPGIGEKRALQLLREYSSLENVLQDAEKMPGKVGENILQYGGQALLGKELVSINKNVPIDFNLEHCRYRKPDWYRLYAVFSRLQFNSIIEKIPELKALKEKEAGSQAERQAGPGSQGTLFEEQNDRDGNVVLVEQLSQLHDFVKKARQAGSFSVLFNDGLSVQFPCLVCAAEGVDTSYVFPEEGALSLSEALQKIKVLFEDGELFAITHDLKPLMKSLIKKEARVDCSFFDTLLAAYLVEPDRSNYPLAEICADYAGLSCSLPGKDRPGIAGEKEQMLYLGGCARDLFQLQKKLQEILQERDLAALYYDLELPLVEVLARMELRGIRVNSAVLEKLASEMDESMLVLEKEIYELAGERFNLNSPKQLSYILFEKLKLPAVRRIKTGYSTDARVLQELSSCHPIAARLLQYRTVSKIKTTYLQGLQALIDRRTGKIHTSFNQTVTATGRLSSSDPNLQNIPVKLEEGRRLREAFTPSHEGYVLLSADYSQIELRILAHLSEDEGLIDAFQKEQDIHTRTAAEVFNVPIDEVTPLMRGRAKAVNFGIVYGISDYGLSQDLAIPRAEARKYIDSYLQQYAGVKEYMERCIAAARQKGYVTTVMNRRRYLPEINHPNYSRRSFAERMALNTPIQGSAADVIKAAMVSIDRELSEKALLAAMLLQVHDELIFELPLEELEEVAVMVKNLMEGVYSFAVPLKVDLKVGEDWYHMQPYERG